MLGRTDVRVLTLTGPGGAGKTRIALHAAAELLDQFRHGAFFVDLAVVRDPALVIPTIAQTLSVKEGAGRSLPEALGDFLGPRQLLLVLDNFEHVVEAAPDVIELLLQAPSVKTLIASRAPMRVAAEHEYPVPELAASEAAALFMERAQAIQPAFQDGNGSLIAEICRRLDGLPLAIELAAARIKLLTPQALLERLDRRLPVLTGGGGICPTGNARCATRSPGATSCWTTQIAGVQRLAVFAGSCSLEAAEEVCEAELDVLGSLVEKSLVRQEEGRLTMLETIREYASEQLDESADADQMNERHATYFLLAAEELDSGSRSEAKTPSRGRTRSARMSWAPSRGLARQVRRSSSFGFYSPPGTTWSLLGCTAPDHGSKASSRDSPTLHRRSAHEACFSARSSRGIAETTIQLASLPKKLSPSPAPPARMTSWCLA